MLFNLIGLLGQYGQRVPLTMTPDDLGSAWLEAQEKGFITPAAWHWHAACPDCTDGVPFSIGEVELCSACLRKLGPETRAIAHFDLSRFFTWLATEWKLCGPVDKLGECLWFLGMENANKRAIFFQGTGVMTPVESRRLKAFREAYVLFGLERPDALKDHSGCSLFELLQITPHWQVAPLPSSHPEAKLVLVRSTGDVWLGREHLGDVLPHSREALLLDLLIQAQNQFVDYDTIRAELLRRQGGHDERDAANFCHRLKSKLLQRVPGLVPYLITSSGNGYRLSVPGELRENWENRGSEG